MHLEQIRVRRFTSLPQVSWVSFFILNVLFSAVGMAARRVCTNSHDHASNFYLTVRTHECILKTVEDIKPVEQRKVTSITLPAEWWETLKDLAHLREIQNDSEAKSFNAVMLEVMGDGIEDARLEVMERKGRRP